MKLKTNIKMGKKGDLIDFENDMDDGTWGAVLSISVTADIQPSLGFTENGPKKRKYPVSNSCVDKKAFLMWDIKGKWADWFRW